MSTEKYNVYSSNNIKNEVKRVYLKPCLHQYGKISALTQAGTVTAYDDSVGGGGSNCMANMSYRNC